MHPFRFAPLILLVAATAAADVAGIDVKCTAHGIGSVQIDFENRSAAPAQLPRVQPSVVVAKNDYDSFWSPFTLTTPPKPLPANQYTSLTLKAKEHRRFTVDLASLRWARSISATWPSLPFRPTVPAGKYQVKVEVGESAPICGSVMVK